MIILFMMPLFGCCVARLYKCKWGMFQCRMFYWGGSTMFTGQNKAIYKVSCVPIHRLAWPTPNPVSMPGSTNTHQMASSSGREKKGTQQENKTEALVLNMSQRCWAQSNLQCIQRWPACYGSSSNVKLSHCKWNQLKLTLSVWIKHCKN